MRQLLRLMLLLCATIIDYQTMALDEGLLDPRQQIIKVRSAGQTGRGLQRDVNLDMASNYPENAMNGVLVDNVEHTNDMLLETDDGLALIHHDTPIQEIHAEHVIGTDTANLLENDMNTYILSPENFMSPDTLLGAGYGTSSSQFSNSPLAEPEAVVNQQLGDLRFSDLSSSGNELPGADTLSSEFATDGYSLTDYGVANIMSTDNNITESSGMVLDSSDLIVSPSSDASSFLQLLPQLNANDCPEKISVTSSDVGDLLQTYKTQPITDFGLQTLGTDIHGHTSDLHYATSDPIISLSSSTSPLLSQQQLNVNGYPKYVSGTSSDDWDQLQTFQTQPITDSGLQALGSDNYDETSGLQYAASHPTVSLISNTLSLLLMLQQKNTNGYPDKMSGTFPVFGDLLQTHQSQLITDSGMQILGTDIYGHTSELLYSPMDPTVSIMSNTLPLPLMLQQANVNGFTDKMSGTSSDFSNLLKTLDTDIYGQTSGLQYASKLSSLRDLVQQNSVTPLQTQTIMPSGLHTFDSGINGHVLEQYQRIPAILLLR